VAPPDLAGKRIVLFSYGSGLASAMYSLRVSPDVIAVGNLVSIVKDIPDRLAARKTVEPGEFEKAMKLRETTHHLAPYTPVSPVDKLFPGTYFLDSVDEKHKRKYTRVPPTGHTQPLGLKSPLACLPV